MFTNTCTDEQEQQANMLDTSLPKPSDLDAKRNERKAREAATVSAETGGCVNGVCQLNWKPRRPTLAA